MKLNNNFISPISISILLLLSSCAHSEQPYSSNKNISYNEHNQLLDLYIPKNRDKKAAIMFIHGGGFKTGSKEQMSGYAELYAKGGFVTTSINYRLTPDHVFPAAINDTKDALEWMKDHANEYGYDANKIVLVGYSAGGTLALNLALDDQTNVAAAVSAAGVTDIGLLILTAPRKQLRKDLATYMGGLKPKLASPINQVSKNDPPIFLFHGNQDDFVPISHSVALASKLKNHNVPVLIREFKDAGHEIMLPNKHLKQLLEEMTKFILTIESK